MAEINREYIKKIFNEYTLAYNVEDTKIKLKIDHTFRVADLCERIAQNIGLSKAQTDLVWLMGMLHDIGRFEQIKRFNTFSDLDSVDHADFGADLLFVDKLIDRFIYSDNVELNRNELKSLEIAIRNHNKYRIEDGLTDEDIVYCNILRDADKIDIFRVNYDIPLEEIYNVTTEQLKSGKVSVEVKKCFDERHAVARNIRKTAVDHLIGHICLLFELIYPISVEITKEQGFFNKLLEFESSNEDTRKWFSYMREKLDC